MDCHEMFAVAAISMQQTVQTDTALPRFADVQCQQCLPGHCIQSGMGLQLGKALRETIAGDDITIHGDYIWHAASHLLQ